jgi:hypothetical protein
MLEKSRYLLQRIPQDFCGGFATETHGTHPSGTTVNSIYPQ